MDHRHQREATVQSRLGPDHVQCSINTARAPSTAPSTFVMCMVQWNTASCICSAHGQTQSEWACTLNSGVQPHLGCVAVTHGSLQHRGGADPVAVLHCLLLGPTCTQRCHHSCSMVDEQPEQAGPHLGNKPGCVAAALQCQLNPCGRQASKWSGHPVTVS